MCTSTVAQAALNPNIFEAVNEAAEHYNLDPKLILAVIQVESKFNPNAVGTLGEVGLMQLHPKFFPDADMDIYRNVFTGVEHLAYVRDSCPQKRDLTWINCYNIGTNRRLIHPKEFSYYKKVMRAYNVQKD